MNVTFELNRTARELRDGSGCRLDPATRKWTADQSGLRNSSVEHVDAITAVAWLQRESQHPLRIPIGVVGPRDATTGQLHAALEVGELLAECGLVVICGGREGVMHAVCEGVKRVGGVSIGLLPDAEPSPANTFVSVILATGIGEARNALIARAAFSLIAVGDSYGTLSEVALGRQFGKLVVGLEGAARLEGVEHVAHARAAVERVALAVLGIAPV
jgi:uncharacterized protein (TIGR00725 family)